MKFGEVIKYDSNEFVYLAQTTEVIHLGKIPNEELSKWAIDLKRKTFTQGSKNMKQKQEAAAWCFVELTTEELKNRAAYYINTGHSFNPEDFLDSICVLNMKDRIALKEEIMKDGHASRELRELIKDLEIKEK